MSDLERDWWTSEAMMRDGIGLVKLIGWVARYSDHEAIARLKAYWPYYWATYEFIGLLMWIECPSRN